MVDLSFIGIGRVGFQALKLFIKTNPGASIRVIDSDYSRKKIVETLGDSIEFYTASTPSEVVELVKGSYLIVTALPSSIAFKFIERLVGNGYNVVDVSYIIEDPYSLDSTARRYRVFYIPDAGFAPGFSNLVIGWCYNRLGSLDKALIYVGGIPVKPVEPIGYQITWNPVDLLEEYIRPARIVRDGEVVAVDPLEEFVEVNISGLGVFEGFYSDGLRTLLRNIDVREMAEITLRYRGHLESIKVLRKLGFLDKKPIEYKGISVKPIEFTARVFEEKLKQTIPDMAILYIIVEKNRFYYKLLSLLVGKLGEPATSRYTALVLAKTAELALREEIEPGVHPLEDLHKYYQDYVDYLEGNDVRHSVETNI